MSQKNPVDPRARDPPDQPSPRTRKETLRELMARKKKVLMEAVKVDDEGDASASALADPYENAALAMMWCRGRTGIVYDVETMRHKCDWDINYPENPARMMCVLERCKELGLLDRCVVLPNARDDIGQRVATLHDPKMFDNLLTVCQNLGVEELELESSRFDAIYINRFTFEAACRSLACCINLVMAVALGEVHNGMAIVRPPGHHAMYSEFCGYCFFNNVAICADSLIRENLASKVLIVDFDVHHGQGTQRMFYERNDVLYFSIHRYENGSFWPNLPESDFCYFGKGKGVGYNINVPLNETGCTDADYMAIIINVLLPVAYEFNPDMILISAGYDAALGCPEGEMELTPGFYAHLITLLSGLAHGKIAVCLEGGYFRPSLAEGSAMTLRGLLGDPCPMIESLNGAKPSVLDSINNVVRCLQDNWKCFDYCRDVDTDNPGTLLPSCKCESDLRPKAPFLGTPAHPPYATRNCYPIRSDKENKAYNELVDALKEEYEDIEPLPVYYSHDEKTLLHRPKEGEAERPERPERVLSILQLFADSGLEHRLYFSPVLMRDFSKYSVHDPNYFANIGAFMANTKDVYTNEHTKEAVMMAVSSTLQACDAIMLKLAASSVAVVRPPGHHAEHKKAMGFCLVNNAAIGAFYLKSRYRLNRVLIIDFDVHHGNGTQKAFYQMNQIMYISVHRYDRGKFFPSDTSANYTHSGSGHGEGYNVNIAFSDDKMGDSEYMMAFHTIILPLAYAYAPQAIVVSAGFDAGINDPLGGYKVSPETFGHFVQMLKPLACGRLILVLEGGYNLNTTSYAMAMCAKSLLGDPLPIPKDLYKRTSGFAIKNLKDTAGHMKKWWHALTYNRRFTRCPLFPESGSRSATSLDEEELLAKDLEGTGLEKRGDYIVQRRLQDINDMFLQRKLERQAHKAAVATARAELGSGDDSSSCYSGDTGSPTFSGDTGSPCSEPGASGYNLQ